MKAKIVLEWDSNLLVNNSYVNGDTKLGRTEECQHAMWGIKMMLTPVSRSFDEDENRRIKVVINAYRPRTNIDPDGLVKAVNDGIKHGIHVDDRFYDTSAIGYIDRDRPRIEISIEQMEETQESEEVKCKK